MLPTGGVTPAETLAVSFQEYVNVAPHLWETLSMVIHHHRRRHRRCLPLHYLFLKHLHFNLPWNNPKQVQTDRHCTVICVNILFNNYFCFYIFSASLLNELLNFRLDYTPMFVQYYYSFTYLVAYNIYYWTVYVYMSVLIGLLRGALLHSSMKCCLSGCSVYHDLRNCTGGCRGLARYCSVEHQKLDWEDQKTFCKQK